MRILLLVNSFPPEIRSASHLFFELSENLVKKGYQVTVITRIPRYNIVDSAGKYKGKLLMKEEVSGIKVLRLATLPLPRGVPLTRALDEFFLALVFFIRGLFVKKQDVVLVYSPPLPLGLSAILLKFLKGTPFIFNVQDIYPQAAIDLGLLDNLFLIKLARAMEKFIYRNSLLITVHSPGNLNYLVSKGVNLDKIKVIYNWVDTDLIKPADKMNQFREKYNLGESFIISFAGVMGFAQDLDVVIEAAKLLEGRKEIKFILIGEGVAKEGLQKKAKKMGLQNVNFLPMQPREIYPQILSASDLCLVTLRKEVKTPVVPGKIMSIMAADRPIVASLPLGGDAAKIIKEAGAGIVIESGRPKDLAEAVLEIYKNPEKRKILGDNGREYAEKNFSREVSIQRYEKLFLQVAQK